jgi:hypothetical protein
LRSALDLHEILVEATGIAGPWSSISRAEYPSSGRVTVQPPATTDMRSISR